MPRLEGKSALVFGAGPNIGGTIAFFLGREGAAVAVCDRDRAAAEATVAFLRAHDCKAMALTGDALHEEDVARVVSEAGERFGTIDIAVNMAGTVHWAPITEMDLAEWNASMPSFPTAGMLVTKHVARCMILKQTRGSIIHVLSTAAHFGEASGAAYTASKAALLNLARSAAMDLAHDGIRVNTITPCAMEHQLWTAMSDEIGERPAPRPDRRSFYSRDDYLKMIPLERFPRAADIAWAAVFLASDETAFLTGVDIPVDGGLRFKYPAWRPGDWTGVNVTDYARGAMVTEYGEPVRPVFPKS